MNVSIVFDIGVWNAWIFTLVLYAAAFVPMLVNSDNAEKRMEEEATGSDQHKVM